MALELEFKDIDKKLLFTINLGIFAIDKVAELKTIVTEIKSPAIVSDVVKKIEDLYKSSETTSYEKINDSKGTITAKKEISNDLDVVENETLASQNDDIVEMKDLLDGNVFTLKPKADDKPEKGEPEVKESKDEKKSKSRFDNDPVGNYLKDLKPEDNPLNAKPGDKVANDKKDKPEVKDSESKEDKKEEDSEEDNE